MTKALAIRKQELAFPRGFRGFFNDVSYALLAREFNPDKKDSLLDNDTYLIGKDEDLLGEAYVKFATFTSIRVLTDEGIMVACHQKQGEHLYSLGLGAFVDALPSPQGTLLDHLSNVAGVHIQNECGASIAPIAMRRAILGGQFVYCSYEDGLKDRIGICSTLDYHKTFDLKVNEETTNSLYWENYENIRNMNDSKLLDPWSSMLVNSNILLVP